MRHSMRRTVAVLCVMVAAVVVASGCQDRPPITAGTTAAGQSPTTKRVPTDRWAVELVRQCDNLERQYAESQRLRQQIQASERQLMDAVQKELPTKELIDAQVKLSGQAGRCNGNIASAIVETMFFTGDASVFGWQSAPQATSRVPELVVGWRRMAETADSAGSESLVRANLQRTIEACAGPYGVLADECLRRHVDREHVVTWGCGDDTWLAYSRFKAGVGESLRDEWRGWWKENQARLEWNNYWWSFRVEAGASPAPVKRLDTRAQNEASTSGIR